MRKILHLILTLAISLAIFVPVSAIDAAPIFDPGDCVTSSSADITVWNNDTPNTVLKTVHAGKNQLRVDSVTVFSGTVLKFSMYASDTYNSGSGSEVNYNGPVHIVYPTESAGDYSNLPPTGQTWPSADGTTLPITTSKTFSVHQDTNDDCGSSNSNATLTVNVTSPPPAALTCTLITQDQTVATGDTGTYSVSINGTSDLNGRVNISAVNLPTGTSTPGSYVTLPGGSSNTVAGSIPIVVADSSADPAPTPGTYSITIKATSVNGNIVTTCGVPTLDITAVQSFELILSPPAQTAGHPGQLDYNLDSRCYGGLSSNLELYHVTHAFSAGVTFSFVNDGTPVTTMACNSSITMHLDAGANALPLDQAVNVSVDGRTVIN